MPGELLIIILAGLCFGSFVTLASYRLPRDESILLPGSRCPSCRTRLKPRDLLPLLSWSFMRGKCRYCGMRVHWRYPAIEIVNACAFVAVYQAHGLSAEAVMLMLMSVALLVMIVADFEHFIIPDEVHLFLLPLGLLWHAMARTPWEEVATGFAVGLALGGALRYGYRYVRRKEGLGLGDVKFLAVAGVWLGPFSFVPFILFSGFFGIATGLAWRALGRGKYFPFGPSLAFSLFICTAFPTLVSLFWRLNLMLYP